MPGCDEQLTARCRYHTDQYFDSLIRYDTKECLTWTQKLSDQLNLVHVARKNMKKKKLKQTNASVHLHRISKKRKRKCTETIYKLN